MAGPEEQQIWAALRAVRDPDSGNDVVAQNMVQGMAVRDGHVGFTLEVDPQRGAALEPLRKACEDAIDALPGVLSVSVVMTAHRAGSANPSGQAAPNRAASAQPQAAAAGQSRGSQLDLGSIRHIIAVASGKGGVGKSTTSVNLALSLKHLGLNVGILDADIYGPSLPRLLDIKEKPDAVGDKLQPIQKYGLATMSIGYLVAEDTPMIWRGPMVMGALEQMLRDVAWGALDVLVVDMPPGTGDAQLTMAQRVPLAGAVIVSTPQDLALLDARKGLNMFRKVEVPVLGIVENMSYFLCPHCGERAEIFGHGGARQTALDLGVPFLGEIPLQMAIREASDAGKPILLQAPQSAEAQAYFALGRAVADRLEDGVGRPTGPKIAFE